MYLKLHLFICAYIYQTFKQSYLRLRGLCNDFMMLLIMGLVQYVLCATY